MPRPLRPIADRLVYHVIHRGNNRQPVFLDDGDYGAFLKAIGDLKMLKPFELYGYCLMASHIHLLLRPGSVSISRIVQSLLISHTQRYHRFHQSGAHGLGQGDALLDRVVPYEALATQSAARRRRWSAYVHRAPVEAELAAIRRSSQTGLPFGASSWVGRLGKRLHLDLTIRPRGRPRKRIEHGNK